MPIAPPLGDHQVDQLLSDLQIHYLRLLTGAVTRSVTGPDYWPLEARTPLQRLLMTPVQRRLERIRLTVVAIENYRGEARLESIAVSPADADSMMGVRRTEHLVRVLTAIHHDQVPGDLIEAGCWRGGALIMMRGFLHAVADDRRVVVGIDSLAGYPRPRAGDPKQIRELHRKGRVFQVSRHEIEERIARFGLLDDRIHIVEGWVPEALRRVESRQVALIKIDLDGYEPTMATLEHFWPLLSDGGVVYVEDGSTPGAQRAITDFRARLGDDTGPLTWVPQKRQMAQWWTKRPTPGTVVARLPGELVV